MNKRVEITEKTLFPFTVRGRDSGGIFSLVKEFLKVKPHDLNWYSFDVVIRSSTEITFIVYDMARGSYGEKLYSKELEDGKRGREISRYDAEVPNSVTAIYTAEKLVAMAVDRRMMELAYAEELIVLQYVEELKEKFL